jgi:tRNA(fMet)-specific endonuclease VapC
MIHLDSNAVIHYLKGDEGVRAHLAAVSPRSVAVSAVAAHELRAGALRAGSRYRSVLETLFSKLAVVPFDDAASRIAASVRHALEQRGERIGPMDVLIAASALAHGAVLVTNNTREFRRIEGLRVEDWRTHPAA